MARRLAVWALAAAFAAPAGAAMVEVTVSGPAGRAYELKVGGVRKQGRVAPGPGPSTFRDSVQVSERGELAASLVFSAEDGGSCACPPVRVEVQSSGPACDPAFVYEEAQDRPGGCGCRSACAPRRKDQTEEDDEAETALALRPRFALPKRAFGNPFTRPLWRPLDGTAYNHSPPEEP